MKKILFLFLFTSVLYGQDSMRVGWFGDSNIEFDDAVLSIRSNVDSIRSSYSKVWVNVGDSTKRHGSTTYTFPEAMWEHNGVASATMGFAGSTYRFNVQVTGVLTRHDPEVIVFMLGTNDAYSGTRTSTQILDTLSALLDSIYNYNSSIRILLSEILPTFDTNTVERAIIQAVNTGMPLIVQTKRNQGKFIRLMETYDEADAAANFQSDGVHLSVTGRRDVARYWYPYIISAVDTILPQSIYPTYYNTWSMGTDAQWNTGSSYYLSSKTFASQLGNITHVIVFPSRDIVRLDHTPYLSVTQAYIDNGGSTQDSLNLFYNGQANPGSGPAQWETRGTLFHLRDSLHANGKYLILGLNAVTATVGINFVLADSARCDTFATATANFVIRHNFDGVDFNTESGITFTDEQLARFFRLLRQKMPNKLITIVPLPTHTDRYAESEPYVNYTWPQFYQYKANSDPACGGSNSVFLSAPLYNSPIPAGSNHQSLKTWSPDDWYTAGWPKSKIVILLSNEANPWVGIDTMFACIRHGNRFWSDSIANSMTSKGGTYVWDAVHIGAYIRGTATSTVTNGIYTIQQDSLFYINILTDRNIDSVVAWGKSEGYLNYGLYDVATDARTPDAVKIPRHAHLSSLLNVTDINSSSYYSTLTPTSSSVFPGSTVTLTVTVNDSLGNRVYTPFDTVTITKQSGTGTIGSVTNNGDGTYYATVTAPADPGSGIFVATVNGGQVKSGTASQTQSTISYPSVKRVGWRKQ